jgi:hypothetical protein
MEPWYEGILGGFWDEQQRYAFWTCILAGAAGHTYGANGLWQMSTLDDAFLGHWGKADWRAAYQYAGSTHLAMAKELLAALPWWELEPCIDWITPHWGQGREGMPLAAAIGRDSLLIYFPSAKRPFDASIRNLAAGRTYRSSWLDARTGATVGQRTFTAESEWVVQGRPSEDDWLLALEQV